MFYKIQHNMVNIQFPNYSQPSMTESHNSINIHKYSFYPAVEQPFSWYMPEPCIHAISHTVT